MEMEYRDPSNRGRWIVILGVVLALAAGGGAFYLINQAQQQAGQGTIARASVVVAARPIAARKPIEVEDVALREIPVDQTNSAAIAVTHLDQVIGKVLSVTVFQDQMITQNMFASGSSGGQFSILQPGETVGPDSEAWRAVSLVVPADRAVGGLIAPGATVDVLMSAQVNVPAVLAPSDVAKGYYTDMSTKITYQNMLILTKAGDSYVIRATLPQAEEIAHLMATGYVQFSMVLRPEQDVRYADASKLGETTNLIIQRYGLPIPVYYPLGNGRPLATAAPTATPSSPTSSSASAAPSSAP
jgi:Flp pilus assembly protein CpaB